MDGSLQPIVITSHTQPSLLPRDKGNYAGKNCGEFDDWKALELWHRMLPAIQIFCQTPVESVTSWVLTTT